MSFQALDVFMKGFSIEMDDGSEIIFEITEEECLKELQEVFDAYKEAMEDKRSVLPHKKSKYRKAKMAYDTCPHEGKHGFISPLAPPTSN